MKRYPTKFRVLMNFDKVKPSETLALSVFQNVVNDFDYRLGDYKMEPGEEMGWFFDGIYYELHFTETRYHDLFVTVYKNNAKPVEKWEYPDILNVKSVLRAKTKPVRVRTASRMTKSALFVP